MCENVIPVISKSLTTGQLALTVPKREFVNYCRYKLIGVNFLPEMIGTEQAYVVSDSVFYPLIDKAGNIVMAGRLLNSDKYCLQFGANGLGNVAHFVVLTCIPTRIAYNPTATLEAQTTSATTLSTSTTESTEES